MQTITLEQIESWQRRTTIAVGVFDGVHIGHKRLISDMVSSARSENRPAVCVTFDPHPQSVVGISPRMIMTLDERLKCFAELGVDYAVVVPFTRRLAQMKPTEFVDIYFGCILKADQVFVGFNFQFGSGGAGTSDSLTELGRQFGFSTRIVPAITLDGSTVSSTAIRQAVTRGEMERAADMLGKAFSLTGEVIGEHGRGRKLGFPTANVKPDPSIITPASGVYAVTVNSEFNPRPLPGIANFGNRPTFGGGRFSLEIHIFDFSDNIYGHTITTTFWKRLRGEQEFASADELRDQIARDCDQARKVLTDKNDHRLCR